MKLTVVTVKQSTSMNPNGLRSARNCDCDKCEIAKHCWEADHNFNWDQKKVMDRDSRLIPRKEKILKGKILKFSLTKPSFLEGV